MNREIYLKSKRQKTTLMKCCDEILESKKEHRIIISPAEKDKTLRQLGGLFGVWMGHLEKQTGFDVAWFHKYLKRKFLYHIYYKDPKNTAQVMWVDGLVILNQLYAMEPSQETKDKLQNWKDRISLGWATIKQMREYMEVIDRHFTKIEIYLPILKKYEDSYKK